MKPTYCLVKEITRIFEKTEGYICTFKVEGKYLDENKTYRNVVNVNTIGKFQKSIDRTICETRNTVKSKFRFVPYAGGDKSNQTSYHIHGLIELPIQSDPIKFRQMIQNKFQRHIVKIFNSREPIKGKVWFEKIEPDLLFGYSKYSVRSENNYATEDFGDEKVLVNMSSFYLGWHQ
jgi:hypothetical protein